MAAFCADVPGAVYDVAIWRDCAAMPPGSACVAPLQAASSCEMRTATVSALAVRRIELVLNIGYSCRSVVNPDTGRVTRIVRQDSKRRHPQLLQLTGTVTGALGIVAGPQSNLSQPQEPYMVSLRSILGSRKSRARASFWGPGEDLTGVFSRAY